MRLVSDGSSRWVMVGLVAACAVLWAAVVLTRGLDRALAPAAAAFTIVVLLRSRLWSMLRMAVGGRDAGYAIGYANGLRDGLAERRRLLGGGRRMPAQADRERDR